MNSFRAPNALTAADIASDGIPMLVEIGDDELSQIGGGEGITIPL